MATEDQKQKQYWRDVKATFDTTGWTHLVNSWKAEADQIKEAVFFTAKTEEDLLVARTRWELLTQLTQLKETVETAETQAEDDG